MCRWVSRGGFCIKVKLLPQLIVSTTKEVIIMANGYYLFDCKMVNRSSQSVVAMASYRSGEKMYSLRDGETKSYKTREVKPESFILKPDNAPEWTLDRELLWNKVEQYEERDNAQLARNVLLGLPNDMTNEQQLELTKEYVQENFVDEGMVADVSIHRDEENNPHAHILLTVRQFDQNKEWEKRKSKRIPVLDGSGNQKYNEKGWRVTRSVKINNWDRKDTLLKWRENWSDKLNEKSLKHGLDKVYSDKSYEDQGRLEKPRFRLTRSEYKFEEKVKKQAIEERKEYEPTTYYAKKNAEIKKYNDKVSNLIHLEDYKADKDYKGNLDKIRMNLHIHPSSIEATNLLVQRAKGYVDYDVANKLYVDFNDERNKWKLKIERAETTINSKRNLYAKIMNEHKDNPKIVERYGYNLKTFKEEIRDDLLELKQNEANLNEEKGKYNELKDATRISLEHQKRLVDAEFSSVYGSAETKKFSYEEKNFSTKLLKEHNILLPNELIKDEYLKQGKDKEHTRLYIPTWKQAKDTMASIDIYDRTLRKLNRSDMNKLSPDRLKDTIIKLSSFKELKSSYEKYLEDITPLIDNEIHSITDNKSVNNADREIKVAILEEYSKLSDDQKENLNIGKFLQEVKNHHKEQSRIAQINQSKSDDDRKELYGDVSRKSSELVDGLFSVIQELGKDSNLDQGKNSKDRTKPYRKRGTDGRVL